MLKDGAFWPRRMEHTVMEKEQSIFISTITICCAIFIGDSKHSLSFFKESFIAPQTGS
jgi:hypothetical protein